MRRRRQTGETSKTRARLPFALGVILVALGLGSEPARGQTPPPTPKPVEAPTAEPGKPKAAVNAKPSKPRPKPEDEDVVVMSTEAMARARGKPLDKDRYDSGPNWAEIPAWRQTSFFGIKAEGKLFIYVVDCSGSMSDEDRLDRAKLELRRTINALQSPQRFKVIFYNDRPVPMPGELPKAADTSSKSQLARWLNLVQPEGGTDPRSSLALALAMRPDAVFLLSDGAFPEGTVDAVAQLNPKKVPIHCVDLANGAAGGDLRKIAADSGGQYAARGR